MVDHAVDAGTAVGAGEPPLSNYALLRSYEPIARFTRGELFFPTAVEPYVERCSLWATDAEGTTSCVVPAGQLNLEGLCAEAVRHGDRRLSLRLVQAPLDRRAYRRWRRRPRERLAVSLRFTTTGMFGRLIDAAFRASLLLRGTVAAGITAAAEIIYREQLEFDRFTYYGRVVRTGGYICLQYWFFYAMNDWRSTFGGVNDHEADWEMVTVYLAERDAAPPRPTWVAFSSHDYEGDDLRRRWDDPELRREGNHPLLFPGAGSHSGAFIPGDYVVTVDPPRLRRPISIIRRVQRLLSPWRTDTRVGSEFGIPFVDYARGDGKVVGPGGQAHWEAQLIDEDTPWVRDYRGLWGLDTEDSFGGERAPSGPRYERDGSIRRSWGNPLGWVGLLKVPPDDEHASNLLAARAATLQHKLAELDETIESGRDELRGRAVEVRALEREQHTREVIEARRSATLELEAKLDGAITERNKVAEELRTLGTVGPTLPAEAPQAHVTRRHGPRSERQQRRTRILRVWAALSVPLLLALVPVVLLAQPLTWLATIGAAALLFFGMEAFARRRFLSFAASVLLLVALAAAVEAFVLLGHQYWRYVLSALFGAAAIALLLGNLGDLGHRWRRGGTIADDPQDAAPRARRS